ncbi:MAG: hypothetical protein CMA70_04680 [Euryarchaeota archaeon]|nr:hypothetical protein [Euryarchaeota archaeon]|tara:strand:- start:47 stop:421 length:375 start_codon:yes stop_codon:yes gene_type:complete
MDAPAVRLQRVLLGILISMVFLTSISIGDGSLVILDEDVSTEDSWAFVFPVVACICGLLLIAINRAGDSSYGSFFLDKWITREEEEEMISRLRKEQDDADVMKMSGAWAELEKDHLEKGLDEEE